MRKLVCGEERWALPLPGFDSPERPRRDGDLPRPWILAEDFEGDKGSVGEAGGLVLVLLGGIVFLGADMILLLGRADELKA